MIRNIALQGNNNSNYNNNSNNNGTYNNNSNNEKDAPI